MPNSKKTDPSIESDIAPELGEILLDCGQVLLFEHDIYARSSTLTQSSATSHSPVENHGMPRLDTVY